MYFSQQSTHVTTTILYDVIKDLPPFSSREFQEYFHPKMNSFSTSLIFSPTLILVAHIRFTDRGAAVCLLLTGMFSTVLRRSVKRRWVRVRMSFNTRSARQTSQRLNVLHVGMSPWVRNKAGIAECAL